MADEQKLDGKARREFLQSAGAAAMAALAAPDLVTATVARNLGMMRNALPGLGAADTDAIRAEIDKRHDESVERLQHLDRSIPPSPRKIAA